MKISASGLRLFDYTVDMRSINHQGIFFDNLSFSNFGYGGDPNDVSRLRIEKNKWYDFRAMFRRDKNYWNYNLLANPLNPARAQSRGAAIVNSPHALDLSRRMQDYDLTLFPQSRLRFRLGYSRNANTGPASTTVEGGTEPLLSENVSYITNSYRMGVDYRGLPKTTLSFDEMLTYSAINNTVTDNNLTYQLANGTPVDLGIVFVGTSPCASRLRMRPPRLRRLTPIATDTCPIARSRIRGRRFPPSASAFSRPTSRIFDDRARWATAAATTPSRDSTKTSTAGRAGRSRAGARPADRREAKRVSANANWSGDYRVTDKLDIVDEFSYDDWRIPSMWATADTNLFATPPGSRPDRLVAAHFDGDPGHICDALPDGSLQRSELPAAQHEFRRRCDRTNSFLSSWDRTSGRTRSS